MDKPYEIDGYVIVKGVDKLLCLRCSRSGNAGASFSEPGLDDPRRAADLLICMGCGDERPRLVLTEAAWERARPLA